MMPKQLPSVYNDEGFKADAVAHAEKVLNTLRVEDVKKALIEAYLKGASNSLLIGYRLAERDYDEVVRYYKNQLTK